MRSNTSTAPASPLSCLLQAYDHAISACKSRSAARAYRTILVLREAHPCDSPSAAGIDAIYAWCERAVLSGDFLGAARTLQQLRTAWEAADRITSVPALPAAAAARVVPWEPLRPEATA
jgi:hypothetical protein